MIDFHNTTIQEWVDACNENINSSNGCSSCRFKTLCLTTKIHGDPHETVILPCRWWEV